MNTDISEHGLESLICTALAGDPNATTHPGNEKARARYEHNRFSVTRQLQYSRDNTRLARDLCLFINGLPVAAFELKNSLTKQTVEDAIKQYNRDRSNGEKLFEFGPVPTCGGTGKPEPEIDRLSNILKTFNELFGNIDWKDGTRSEGSSPRSCLRRSPLIRLTGTRWKTRTGRTHGSSTTRRSKGP